MDVTLHQGRRENPALQRTDGWVQGTVAGNSEDQGKLL